MGWNLPSFNRRKVSLLIQDHVIRFVDTKNPDVLDVRQYGEKYLPEGVISNGTILDPDGFLMVLEECVADWGIKGRDVWFNVPDAKVVLRRQSLPPDVAEEEIKGFLYMELGTSIHIPFENPVFDFVFLEQNEQRQEILLFAAPEETVLSYTALLDRVKLRANAADASFLALYRYVHQKKNVDADEHVLCLQFDLRSVELSIFHEHKPAFFNHLKMAVELSQVEFNHAHSRPSISYTGDAGYLHGVIDDMITEIQRIADHYRNKLSRQQAPVTKVILSGEHPEMAYIQARLKQTFAVTVDTITPIDTDRSAEMLPPRFDTVLGLGLREVQHAR